MSSLFFVEDREPWYVSKLILNEDCLYRGHHCEVSRLMTV